MTALDDAYDAILYHATSCLACQRSRRCPARDELEATVTREKADHQRRQQALDRLADALAALPTEQVEQAVLAALRELTAGVRHRAAWSPGLARELLAATDAMKARQQEREDGR